MENLNLVINKKDEPMIGAGTIKMVVLIIVTLLVYGGLNFYSKSLQKNTEDFIAQFGDKYSSFIKGDEARKVMDFQDRLLIAENLITKERNVNEDLNAIALAIRKGVYIDSYSYNGAGGIDLNCYADSYSTIAKQLLSFKSSPYFSSVSMNGKTFIDTERLRAINFKLSLKIK